MKKVEIKRIFSADFRKSARTLYDEIKGNKSLWKGEPSADEVYIFVSYGQNQILFITGNQQLTMRAGSRHEATRNILDYRCWRIEGSTFSAHMLEDYGRSVGLTFGLKTFEEKYRLRKSICQ